MENVHIQYVHIFQIHENNQIFDRNIPTVKLYLMLTNHSSEIRGLCSMECCSEMLQKGNRTFAMPNLRED